MTSIGRRLILQVTTGTVVVMVFWGAVNVIREVRAARSLLESSKSRIVEQLASGTEQALWDLNDEQIRKIVQPYLIDPDVVSVEVREGTEVYAHFAKDLGTGEVVDLTQAATAERLSPVGEAESTGVGPAGETLPPGHDERSVEVVRDSRRLGVIDVVFSDQRVRRQMRSAILTSSVGVLFLVFVLAVLVGQVVRRGVSEPLLEVVHAADRIAAGDVEVELPEVEGRDEIGTLIMTFRDMVHYLQEMAGLASRIAAGDLSGFVEPRSPHDALGTAFLRMSEYLRTIEVTARGISEGRLTHDLQPKSEHDALGHALVGMLGYLEQMAESAAEIATGSLSVVVSPRSAEDRLGIAFQRMTTYLSDMSHAATAIAAGDLRLEVEPRSGKDQLGLAFREMRNLRDTVINIQREAETLGESSIDLRRVSGQMTSHAGKASEGVGIVSRNSEAISAKTAEVASATAELLTSINAIVSHTGEVGQVVRAAVEKVVEARTTIGDLDRNSEQIGEIVGEVTAIAKHSHLLAINAEIQAARSGSAARGGGVVAQEVRELAGKTASFAASISGHLEVIRALTGRTQESVREVTEVVGQVELISREIAEMLELQVATTEQIARRIDQAALEGEGVHRAIVDVAEVSKATSDHAARVEDAARKGAEIASRLQALIDNFEF